MLLIVANKAKSQISKRVFQENKAYQIFRKNEHFLHPDTHTYVRVHIRGWEIIVFQKIWCALFSWNTHFEIRLFALLPTNGFI